MEHIDCLFCLLFDRSRAMQNLHSLLLQWTYGPASDKRMRRVRKAKRCQKCGLDFTEETDLKR